MMAVTQKFLPKQVPTDIWSLREKAALASSVKRSGDNNWVSVSRAIKPYGESNRPSDWFSQKNCALQYSDLLEKVETPKRKRGERESAVESPGDVIVRKLTIERIEELKRVVTEEQKRYKKLKHELDLTSSGNADDRLTEFWEEIEREKKEAEDEEKAWAEKMAAREVLLRGRKLSTFKVKVEQEENTQDSIGDSSYGGGGDDSNLSQPSMSTPQSSTSQDKPSAAGAGILSLDQSLDQDNADKDASATSLGQEALGKGVTSTDSKDADGQEHNQLISADDIKTEPGEIDVLTTSGVTMVSGVNIATSGVVKEEVVDSAEDGATTTSTLAPSGGDEASEGPGGVDDNTGKSQQIVDEKCMKQEMSEDDMSTVGREETVSEQGDGIVKQTDTAADTESDVYVHVVDDLKDDKSLDPLDSASEAPSKDEDPPLSPTSSIMSNDTDGGSFSTRGKGRNRRNERGRGGRRSGRYTRNRLMEEDDKAKESETSSKAESSDEDDDGDPLGGLLPESDDTASNATGKINMSFTESVPNSPASIAPGDTEDDKAHKVWKKSIMLVWRAACNHKYANVFSHPVTEEIAPGYHSVVQRPLDLSQIKKNIESGQIRSTAEFQRDMMLMFTNAIMYNNSDHDVFHMATEMYDDVMRHIEQYVHTQIMVQGGETKLLRTSRRSEAQSDKEEEPKRKRQSLADQDGGKIKKRKPPS